MGETAPTPVITTLLMVYDSLDLLMVTDKAEMKRGEHLPSPTAMFLSCVR